MSMNKECSVKECNKKVLAKEFCNAHYIANKKYGDPSYWFHGLRDKTKHPLYYTWRTMHRRCDNKNSPRWLDYGGRGIKVCERWSGTDGFSNFIADMGDRPDATYQLDRIDNNGNYEPTNCRWVTRSENQMNKRMMKNNTSGFPGVGLHTNNQGLTYWRVRIGGKTVGYFEDLSEAIGARLTAESDYGTQSR